MKKMADKASPMSTKKVGNVKVSEWSRENPGMKPVYRGKRRAGKGK